MRQAFLADLIQKGHIPGLIGVEVSLSSLPHLQHSKLKLPSRRADIILFSTEGFPLVLVECKSVAITKAHIQQVIGYNYYVKAPHLVLVNPEAVLTGTFNGTEWTFQAGSKISAIPCLRLM